MHRRIFLSLALLCLPLLAAAQQPEPTVYTFVAQWAIPRDKWDEFTGWMEKSSRPVLDRRLADGTLVGWGQFATVVHEEGGNTHGAWFSATSIAALERVRDELIKLPPSPAALAASKHHDHLLSSFLHRVRPGGSSGSGYFWVTAAQVERGKGEQFRALWDKYVKPTFDELLANGTILAYELAGDYVVTEAPGMRYGWYLVPNAEGEDKVEAAFNAVNQKRTPEERRAISAAFAEVTVAGTFRSNFLRVLSYAQK